MIKTLAKSLREHKKGTVFTVLLSVVEAGFEILIPLCMAELIDKGVDLGDMGAVWKYGIALLIFAILQLISGILSAHVAAKTAVGFSANLRQDMYNNVQTFAFSNVDKFSTASIVTRLTTDVTNIQNAYQMLIRMAIRGPVILSFVNEDYIDEANPIKQPQEKPVKKLKEPKTGRRSIFGNRVAISINAKKFFTIASCAFVLLVGIVVWLSLMFNQYNKNGNTQPPIESKIHYYFNSVSSENEADGLEELFSQNNINQPIYIIYVLDYEPYEESDLKNNSINSDNADNSDELLEQYRANAAEYYTAKNNYFIESVGLDTNSSDYSITISSYSPYVQVFFKNTTLFKKYSQEFVFIFSTDPLIAEINVVIDEKAIG